MKIICPYNQRLMTKRAHDILMIKTCHSLATADHEVYLIVGNTHSSTAELLQFYGLQLQPHLHIIQIPILRRSNFPKISWHFIFNIFCLREILFLKKKVTPDIIYLNEMKLAKFLLQFKKWFDVPFVYEIHGLYAKNYQIPEQMEKRVFSGCDLLITPTLELKRKLLEIYHLNRHIVKVPLAASPIESIAQNHGKTSKKKIFYAGQFYPLQGVPVLIKAMAYLPEWVELHLVGGKREEISNLSAFAEAFGVKQRVNFHGFVPHGSIPSLLMEADIVVTPALDRGKMPIVAHTKIYEYLALGRPIVATDMPSIREEIEDGVHGILVPPENPKALAEGIMKVLHDPLLFETLSKNALEKSRRYTWQKRAENLTNAFLEAKIAFMNVQERDD